MPEFSRFMGLCLQMGLVKMPKLRDYWSSRSALGGHSIGGMIMSHYRFKQILRTIHFADNNLFDSNRLYKINPFLQLFNKSCSDYYKAGKEVCIDEFLVPFRGRIVFRQYIPSKRQRYGIKLFKLSCQGGYTVKTKVYAGKDPKRQGSVADSVVMELMEGYLDQGCILCTDIGIQAFHLQKL